MLPDEWRTVRKILAVQVGNVDELIKLSPTLKQLKRVLPEVTIALLCSPQLSRVALSLPAVDEVLLHWALAQPEGVLDCNSLALLPLIEMLRSQQFDAAILFPQAAQSPYPLAYVCYLAEIPIRVGWSDEFGGGLLSHWVKASDLEEISAEADRSLGLLEAIGLGCTSDRQPDVSRERA
ncbi:glycosyltransferase family 9 protein [Phormidesmis priestleyi]